MKYKVGDKVRIKRYLQEDVLLDVVEEMLKYKGKVATITEVYENNYTLDIDGGYWEWFDEVLEDVATSLGLPNESTKKIKTTTDKLDQFINDRVLVYLKKNKDYGNSADDTADAFGYIAYLIRVQDKIARIEQLHKATAEVNDEAIEDTLLDLINYIAMYNSYSATGVRLITFISELQKLLDNPTGVLKGINSDIYEATATGLQIKGDTIKYIADYIKVCIK